ncbi:MAG: xanthine dehydrogenase family protein subunit M [Chloroflexi bacterium]|jgi:carbon-monoxide dehydrogenase medium subunit|nr:xanthine dehydrogenase family protein subunit M [Chloroflexota bacterium]
MKPAPFTYIAPTSLEEALAALDQHGYDAKLLAGGQSLIPVMNFRLAQPAVIVDLNGVSELGHLQRNEAGGLRLGAMVRQRMLELDETIAALAPLLHEAMPHVAHPQIRNRGTLGGSLAHADPAGELPVITVALEARFCLRRLGGERWVSAEDFYQGLFMTALEPEEILVEVAIPPLPAQTGYAFLEVARRHGDYAQAGVAALVTVDGEGVCRQARLVYLNLGEIPRVAYRAAALLIDQPLSPELIAEAANQAAQEEIDPTADIHATVAYKRHLAEVLGRRALQQAAQRARQPVSVEGAL